MGLQDLIAEVEQGGITVVVGDNRLLPLSSAIYVLLFGIPPAVFSPSNRCVFVHQQFPYRELVLAHECGHAKCRLEGHPHFFIEGIDCEVCAWRIGLRALGRTLSEEEKDFVRVSLGQRTRRPERVPKGFVRSKETVFTKLDAIQWR